MQVYSRLIQSVCKKLTPVMKRGSVSAAEAAEAGE